jgi:hypothetical protein
MPTPARYAVVACASLLMLTGCGGGDSKTDSTAQVGGDNSGSLGPPTVLTLSYSESKGGKPETARLTCTKDRSSGTGYLASDADATCKQIDSISSLLIEGPDLTKACTQVYGGPQTLRVSGRVDYKTVNRTFERTNGCQIADWKELEPLLPANAPT